MRSLKALSFAYQYERELTKAQMLIQKASKIIPDFYNTLFDNEIVQTNIN